MSIDQSSQVAQAYSWLRSMSGGKLEQSQVIAGDEIIACHGLTTFATLIGFSLTNTVSGHFDISGYGYSIIRESEGFRNQVVYQKVC